MSIDTILGLMFILFLVICAIIAKIIWILAMQLEPAFKAWLGIDYTESNDRRKNEH